MLRREDDYAGAGKPVCDYDDPAAREALVDALARDAQALLAALDGRELATAVRQAAALLATVVGQDLDEDEDGVFRIARRVAKDRVISTVDPQARHGHKTAARGFDGYKGHVAVDPDREIITATAVTAGNAATPGRRRPARRRPAAEDPTQQTADTEAERAADRLRTRPNRPTSEERAGGLRGRRLRRRRAAGRWSAAGAEIMCKVQPPTAPGGRFAKDEFDIDLTAGTVTCPGGHTTPIRRTSARRRHRPLRHGLRGCPLAARCTTSPGGRTSASAPRGAAGPRPRHARPTRPGGPTTAPPAPRSNARSVT